MVPQGLFAEPSSPCILSCGLLRRPSKCKKVKSLYTHMAFLKVKLLTDNAQAPKPGTPGSAGYDLYSVEDVTIEPHCRKLIGTGIAIEIPSTCYGRVASRSGLAVKYGIEVGAGVVDSSFRLEVKVLLYNHGDTSFSVTVGDRIAQLILENIITPEVTIIEDLSSTERSGGFGSTGMR